MTALPKHRMTVDDFLAWAATQEGRWELFDGVPVAMSPERAVHGRVKLRVANALERAIDAAGLPCQALLDSVAVRIGRHRSYQPDALISCGDALSDDALEAPNPIVVVEVLSPSNAMKDLRVEPAWALDARERRAPEEGCSSGVEKRRASGAATGRGRRCEGRH